MSIIKSVGNFTAAVDFEADRPDEDRFRYPGRRGRSADRPEEADFQPSAIGSLGWVMEGDPPALESRMPEELRREIASMERRRGWHGPGSRAIGRGACLAAIGLVEQLMQDHPGAPLPEVSPSPRGGVTLVWRIGRTSVLVRVFDASGTIYFQHEGADYRVQTGQEEGNDLLARLRGMLAKA